MIKYLVAAALALFLLAAKAEVIATTHNSDSTLVMELHSIRGECAGDLRQAQILVVATKELVTKGCWAEINEMIGILWDGETELRVAPAKVFRWART